MADTRLAQIRARDVDADLEERNPQLPPIQADVDRRWLLALVDRLVGVASAAQDIASYDWSENDPDACAAVEHLMGKVKIALAALTETEES